ncbi:MAG: class I SAM-dependent methyltransferase [Dehalococcoidia bacterium]
MTTRSGPVQAVQRQFGAVAAAYVVSAVHASGADLVALIEAAGLTGHERVLDLGCGAGHTALAAAPHAASVVAVDVTPEMLAVAADLAAQRGVSNVEFRQADVAALPFPAASFDVVTSRYSAHHYADPAMAFAEAARVLRPGGRLLLADTVSPEDGALDTFMNAVELLRDASHVRNPRRSEWRRLLAEAGFEPEIVFEMPIVLDGENWVQRIQTPADRVTAIRMLFATAPAAARDAFSLRDAEGWGWTIPMAVYRAELRP